VQFDSQYGYQKLYGQCEKLFKPLNIGGDHSVASSSVLASLQKYRDLQVLWIDAHPDIHTYSSTVSGNTHGTPLSVCTGLEKTHWASRLSLKMLDFSRLIYVGIRDIDDFEAEVIAKHNIRHYTMQ
jgi:arginase